MNKNIFTPTPESICNFEQAVEYIAFGWEPLSDEDEDLQEPLRVRFDWRGAESETDAVKYRQDIKRAQAKLKKLLKAGLKFMATPYNNNAKRFIKEGNFFTLYEDWAKSVCMPYQMEIERGLDLVLHIYEQNQFITSFGEIHFIYEDLKEALEEAECEQPKILAQETATPINNTYTTPL